MANDGGGLSDAAIINETRPRQAPSSGWATLGSALAGGGQVAAQDAYDQGLRLGASTVDALAQARDRIQKTQGASAAAAALRNPQVQGVLGLKPEEAEYGASLTEAGAQPEQVTGVLKGFQQQRLGAVLADPNADPAQRHAALFALHPEAATMHAEGANGTYIDPLASNVNYNAPPSATNTPVTVGDQQTALNNSEIQLRKQQGQAAIQNANAHQDSVDNKQPAASKLQTGYKWDVDTDPNSQTFGSVKTGPDGTPIQIPNANAGGEGAVQQRYTNRMVSAASGLAKETGNLSRIGLTASTGAQIGAGHPNSLLGAVKDNLGKSLSTDDSQNYAASMANVDRQLGMLETAGGVPPGTYVTQLRDATTNVPGSSTNARLYHAAIIRQIVEQAAEQVQAGAAGPTQKQAIFDAASKIQSNVPFTPSEVIDFGREGKPGQTFEQYLATKQGRDKPEQFGTPRNAPAPAATPSSAPPPGFKVLN